MIPSLPLFKRIPALTQLEIDPLFSRKTALHVTSEAFNVKAFPIKKPFPSSMDYTATIIVGKKSVSKLSVIRYRAKRRLKAVIADGFPLQAPKGFHYIFYVAPPIVTLPWTTLQTRLTHALDDLSKKIDKQKNSDPMIKSSHRYPKKQKRKVTQEQK
ncbi:hypothetical protein BDA99DRAFT_303551 [Phascolomyces articulosus]|uniref:Uncharacterized protein n=1 Tax=Phascolomyces articulosus TaxID=60185 RepID=A0AAD5PIQ8_9FUNG|nr:hypothetical protein BDA99DRAFT_303551 [Phascolomyces articulosus]